MNTPSEEIKQRLDIAEVIGGYVRLVPAGTNTKALCPFHHEKTPSFYVSRDKQIWHCFGCGLGGDIFAFVMKIEGLEFVEALRLLADRAGVVLRQVDPRVRTERMRMQDLVTAATAFYEEVLAGAVESDVRAYIRQRGVADQTRTLFHIGYAPHISWDGLVRHLKFHGWRPEEIERAGLAVRDDQGRWRDRFHNRIMFPLFDAQGVAVGFSGRHFVPRHPAASQVTPAKYVNTPETLLYQKSRLLYGLNLAKETIRKAQHAVLVEGQFDVVLSHQAGVSQAIATSGTALTEDHIRILKRHTARVRTAFDNDAAGVLATNRSVLMLLENDMAVEVIRIDGGKDPADLVAEDPARWLDVVEHAEPILEFYLRSVTQEAVGATVDEKRNLAQRVLPVIGAIANPIIRGHYISQLASLFHIEARYLQEALARLATAPTLTARRDPATQNAPAVSVLQNRWTDIEEYLIALLAKYPSRIQKIQKRLSENLFSLPLTRELYSTLQTARMRDGTEMLELDGDAKTKLDYLALKLERYLEHAGTIDPDREISFFAQELETRRVRSRLRELSDALRAARSDTREAILAEFSKLSAQLQEVEKPVSVA